MTTKMKGLLKGLRYITQIFDNKDEEEEQEMQIGHPTDVKHVGHIGCNDRSVTSPTWMNEFRSGSHGPAVAGERAPKDLNSNGGGNQEAPLSREVSEPRRPRRRNASFDASSGEPLSGESRHSRRHQSAGGGDASEGSRQHRRSKAAAGTGNESPPGELPALPKQSRRSKTKGSTSGGGSTRSSRNKDAQAPWSDLGAGDDRTSERLPELPSMKTAREEEVF